MKKYIYIAIGVVVVIVLSTILFVGKNNTPVESDSYLTDAYILNLTYEYSKEYIDLRIRTDNVLLNAEDFESYEAWDDEMTRVGFLWEQMAEHADFLEEKADAYSQLSATPDTVGFLQVPTAQAYTKSAITNIYDSAPAGQGIKKLASYLGVDARRAFQILKGDQEQMKADAFIKGGNSLRNLENSAVVLKDGCKVAGFVGGVVLSGGAAGFAASGVVAQGTVVVTGTDMVLEVTDDAANIAMGDSNKVSAIVGTARSFTEPVASILSLNDVAKNLASNAPGAAEKFANKANAVLFNADQVRAIVQDEKVLGISFADSPENEKARQAFAAGLKENEVKQWIKENTTEERTVADSLDDLANELPDRTVADSLDDLANELPDRTVLDSLNDLESELEYKELIKEFVDQQNRELEAERQQIDEEADERIKAAEEELNQQATEETNADNKSVDAENFKADDSEGDIVDKYMREMAGKKMNDFKIFMGYGNKFEELYDQGLITREEQDALMVEATRLNEGKAEVARSVEEQETELLDKNYEKYVQINNERPSMDEIFKMSEAERTAVEEAQMQKQADRQALLKTECAQIYKDDPEEAEMCYFRGKF